MCELAVTNKPVFRLEMPLSCHKLAFEAKHSYEILKAPLSSSESHPVWTRSLHSSTQLSQYTRIITTALLHVVLRKLGQLCEMIRPLSLSDAIITAASLNFLPRDSPQLPYPETDQLISACVSGAEVEMLSSIK